MIIMPFKFSGEMMVDIINATGIICYLSGKTMLDFYLVAYLECIPDGVKIKCNK